MAKSFFLFHKNFAIVNDRGKVFYYVGRLL